MVRDNYKIIPDSLFFKDRIYQFIIPNKKNEYWKVSKKEYIPYEEINQSFSFAQFSYRLVPPCQYLINRVALYFH